MPIFEYENPDPSKSCVKCGTRFEVIHMSGGTSLLLCPDCGSPVRKVISSCRINVPNGNGEIGNVEERISAYEKHGMWSHAAELAEKLSNKDQLLQGRALENYKKAGYDIRFLDRYAEKVKHEAHEKPLVTASN
jgi:putative FmdB family regulatory protein